MGQSRSSDGSSRYGALNNTLLSNIPSELQSHIHFYHSGPVLKKNLSFQYEVSYDFGYPMGACIGSGGDILVVDYSKSCLVVFGPTLAFKSTVPITGGNHWGIAIDKDGTIAVSNRNQHKVNVLDPTLKEVQQEGAGWHCPSPEGIAFSRDGRILAAEGRDHQIQCWDRNGVSLGPIIDKKDPQPNLTQPGDVAVDPEDNILVLQLTAKPKLLKFTPQGGFIRELSSGLFESPHFLTVDGIGQMVVSDCAKNQVFILDPEGDVLQTLGTKGEGPAQMTTPAGTVIDRNGNLIVVDNGNKRLQFWG